MKFEVLEINSLDTILLEISEHSEYIDSRTDLLPSSLNKASNGRKREFLAGRICAEELFLKHNLTNIKIQSSKSRAPIWPEGFIGSISHTKFCAVCSLADNKTYSSVGIDIEKLIPRTRFETISKLITTESDQVFLSKFTGDDLLQVQTILFSGKEALYKAIFPHYLEYFGFQEASIVDIDFNNQLFTLEISSNTTLSKFNGEYSGEFLMYKDHILTSIKIKNT